MIKGGAVGSPENHLFQAVLAQAFTDATAARASATKHNGGLHQDERAEARKWLLGGGTDMQTVCFLADIEHDTVQRAAETLAHMHWRWRRVGVPVSLKDKAAAAEERRVTRDYGFASSNHSFAPTYDADDVRQHP
jgi:hypothetical protein